MRLAFFISSLFLLPVADFSVKIYFAAVADDREHSVLNARDINSVLTGEFDYIRENVEVARSVVRDDAGVGAQG